MIQSRKNGSKINAKENTDKVLTFVRKAVNADGFVSAFAPQKAFAGTLAA